LVSQKDKDILEKDSRKPVELPMPSPNKQHGENKYEGAHAAMKKWKYR
jgi:hypothetical protein